MADLPVPVVGQEVYVPTDLYLSHGIDDVRGGPAKVTKVVEEKHGDRTVHSIQVEEMPDVTYSWENQLADQQEKLRGEFGDQRARPDPDEREEFNSWAVITPDTIRRWLKEGLELGATHVIVIDDDFDFTYYPVYVMPGEDPRKKAEETVGDYVISGDDQGKKEEETSQRRPLVRVVEVYSLSRDLEAQIAEEHAFHYD